MTIYVGNMNYKMTETELKDTFAEFGEVDFVKIIRDRNQDNRSKGFGFVDMNHEEEANRAIEALDGTEVMSRNLRVNKALPRKSYNNTP